MEVRAEIGALYFDSREILFDDVRLNVKRVTLACQVFVDCFNELAREIREPEISLDELRTSCAAAIEQQVAEWINIANVLTLMALGDRGESRTLAGAALPQADAEEEAAGWRWFEVARDKSPDDTA